MSGIQKVWRERATLYVEVVEKLLFLLGSKDVDLHGRSQVVNVDGGSGKLCHVVA
jgi:hypothetical protein